MNDFPKNLKTLREERKLSQQTVADNIGVSQQAYGLYERGKREPNLTTLKKIAKLFRVSVDWLLGFSLDIALDRDDREFTSRLASKAEMGNAELVGSLFAQGGEIIKARITGKEPREINKDLMNHAREVNKDMKKQPKKNIGCG